MKIFQTPTGNSAEDEQNNKRHAKRYRVYLIILAVWVAFLLILITVLTPMLVLQRQDNDVEWAHRDDESTLANNFTTQFRDAILGAISAVYGVEGYIMGEMKSLPQLNATPAERVAGQYFPTFYSYAALVASSSPNIGLFLTAPGGVLLQAYPLYAEKGMRGWDLLNSTNFGMNYSVADPAGAGRVSPYETIRTGALALTGPYYSPGFIDLIGDSSSGAASDEWWVDLRQPIYNATTTADISNTTFWGFAAVALSVDGLMRSKGFPVAMDASQMAYVVYTIPNSTTGACSIIMASESFGTDPDCNSAPLQDFINDATTRDVLKEQLSWKIALKSTQRVNKLTDQVRNAIVISSVVGVVVLFIVGVFLIVRCTQVYDGTVHAPKVAPFAMLTIGPCRGEELWDLASDQMVEVTERLGQVLARQMVRYRAYQIQQVHPLTTSYVTRSVSSAVQMAFATIEELYSSPIDDPLRRLLGDEGSLLLSYAVHWCTDAAVRVEAMGGGFRYEGPDVVYGGRMWVFAGPNVVTVSPAALSSTARMPHIKSKLFDSVFLRGVTTRQDLYVVTDTTNHRLKEAEAFAADQVRRARQAQLQYAADKEGEGSSDYATRDRLLTTFPRNGYEGSSDLAGASLLQRGGASGSEGGAVALRGARKDGAGANFSGGGGGVMGGSSNNNGSGFGAHTAIVVPSSTPVLDGAVKPQPVSSQGVVDGTVPTTASMELQRRMVRRPAKQQRGATNVISVSSTSSSSAAAPVNGGRADREVEMAAVEQPVSNAAARGYASNSVSVHTPPSPSSLYYQQQAQATATSTSNSSSATSMAVRPRRVQVNGGSAGAGGVGGSSNGSCAAAANAVRHPDLLPSNPFVVVPPSAKVVAAAHGLVGGSELVLGGASGMASTPSAGSEESNLVRRAGNIMPTSVYDNPLAHDMNLAAAAAAAKASALNGTLVACTSYNSEGNHTAPNSAPVLDHFSSDLLLRPAISSQSDMLLRTVFDRQAVALDVSYDSVRVLVYYFYSSYKILFRPLAAPELHNIYRRLMAAFGVPHQGILEHLAARCAIRFLQRHEETQTLLWDQQHRLQAHARTTSAGAHTNTTTSASVSVSDDAGNSISA